MTTPEGRAAARRWHAPAEPEAGARCGQTHWWKAYAAHSLVDGTRHRAAIAGPCVRACADDERARARRIEPAPAPVQRRR